MPQSITIPTSTDSSVKLQALINNAGNTPTEFVFSEDNNIEVSSPIRFYPAVKVSGNGVIFHMKDRASKSIFPSMTPVIGAKSYGGTGFEFSGLVFDGNSDSQTVPLGKGFHNFIGLNGASDIAIHDIHLHDSTGDMARLTNVKFVKYYKNNVIRCGHDGLYVDGGSNIKAWDNHTELRTNSALRLRHVSNGHLYNNYIINKIGGGASCPGIQIENSISGRTSKNILIENNEIRNVWGPGIWIIGTDNTSLSAASNLTVKNNLFFDCGNMDGDYHHLPGVGGIVATGWNNLDVSYNTFDKCKGYGVLFGSYYGSAHGSGYKATIYRNIFTGTRKANTVGTASGSPVAKLDSKYTGVVVSENCFYDNAMDPYGVKPVNSMTKNPQYVSTSDYHLRANSPCRFTAGYQLGRYNGTGVPDTITNPSKQPAFLKFKCSEEELEVLKRSIPNNTILRRD